MKKYLKIFVVSLCLAALLTFSCFATSSQITSTDYYSHYISPGNYVFKEHLTTYGLSNVRVDLNFTNGDNSYLCIYFYPDDNTVYFSTTIPASEGRFLVYDNEHWVDDSYRYITVEQGFYVRDLLIFQWWTSNLTRVNPGFDSNFLDTLVSLFTAVGTWISESVTHVSSMFWDGSVLTFPGTLAVAGLAFSVAFLIVGLIQNFLHFRG